MATYCNSTLDYTNLHLLKTSLYLWFYRSFYKWFYSSIHYQDAIVHIWGNQEKEEEACYMGCAGACG